MDNKKYFCKPETLSLVAEKYCQVLYGELDNDLFKKKSAAIFLKLFKMNKIAVGAPDNIPTMEYVPQIKHVPVNAYDVVAACTCFEKNVSGQYVVKKHTYNFTNCDLMTIIRQIRNDAMFMIVRSDCAQKWIAASNRYCG